jgi:hypothetical protein
VYDRFRTWTEDGTLDRILDRLREELDLEGEIDWEQFNQFNVDGTTVPASPPFRPAHRSGQPTVPASRAASGGPTDGKKGIESSETTRPTPAVRIPRQAE